MDYAKQWLNDPGRELRTTIHVQAFIYYLVLLLPYLYVYGTALLATVDASSVDPDEAAQMCCLVWGLHCLWTFLYIDGIYMCFHFPEYSV